MRQRTWVILAVAALLMCDSAWAQTESAAANSNVKLSWVKVTEHAGFRPRDSAGEVVYDGKMWLLGGWFDSFGPFPRDVWNSDDGVHWKQVTAEAPWRHGDLPVSLVFQDKLWMLSGWYDGRRPTATAGNEVWCSSNGVQWQCATAKAPWAARCAAAGAVLDGKMWILGGTKQYYFGTEKDLLNDVWSSDDGEHWRQATAHAPWQPRAYLPALAFKNKLWIFGGGNYLPKYEVLNDVWSSDDGEHWTQVTEHAPWSPRIWHTAAVYKDRMWIFGGSHDSGPDLLSDVWYSSDGEHWTQLQTDATWSGRHEMSTYVFQNKLWMVAGYAKTPFTVVDEVWQLEIPDAWFQTQ